MRAPEPPIYPIRVGPRDRKHGGFNARSFLSRTTVILVVFSLLSYLLVRVEPPDRHALQDLQENKFLLGAWLGSWPGGDNRALERFERRTGAQLDLVDVFVDWYTPMSNLTPTLLYITDRGRDNDTFPNPSDYNDGKLYQVRFVTVP